MTACKRRAKAHLAPVVAPHRHEVLTHHTGAARIVRLGPSAGRQGALKQISTATYLLAALMKYRLPFIVAHQR